MKKKVIIIGLDGASWNILNKMLDKLPNLRKIIDGGCSGNLISTIPYLTPLAWTSAFTGVNPGKHGIFDFVKCAGKDKRHISSLDVKYPYIWETLSRRNMKTIAVAIPFAYPAKDMNGIMITGFGTPWIEKGFTFPPSFKDDLLKNFPKYAIDPSHSFEGNPSLYKKEAVQIATQNAEVTKKLIGDNPDWELFITVFSSPDWLQHFFWGHEKIILPVYKIIDEFIGWVLEHVYDENTWIILMSDHGFKGRDKLFHVNRYLENEGFLKTKKSLMKTILLKFGLRRRVLRNLDIFGLRRFLPLGVKHNIPKWKAENVNVDFENSKAWNSPIAGAGVIVKDDMIAEELKIKFSNLKDPQNDKKIFKKIWKSTDLYWGPYSEELPRVLFVPNEPYSVLNDYPKEMITTPDPSQTSGAHELNGIYAVFGKDISHKKMSMFIWDITSIALTLLDVPLYDDMDGQVRKEMFVENSEVCKRKEKRIKNISSITKKLLRCKHGKKGN